MRLFLVRHGSAEDPAGRADPERALTDEGRREVAEVSGAIAAAMEAPIEVLSSPYLRAEQTAEVLREILGIKPKLRATDAMLPDSDFGALRPALADLGARGTRTVIAVGHNPSISIMVGQAVAGGDGARVAMAKAAVACIDLDDLNGRAAGELRWLISPKAVRGAKRV